MVISVLRDNKKQSIQVNPIKLLAHNLEWKVRDTLRFVAVLKTNLTRDADEWSGDRTRKSEHISEST